MRKSKYSEEQIIGALKRAEQGVAVKDICRELGISNATFYQWRSKYGGLEASDLRRLKELETENRRLKQMSADLSLVIPPKIGVAQKWNILIMAGQEIPHAKITIQRPPDSEHSQAGRGRDVGPGPVPRARHQQRDVLQVAGQVRRHGCLADGPAQGA